MVFYTVTVTSNVNAYFTARTVTFSERDTALSYKRKLEEMLVQASSEHDFNVIIDSCNVNNYQEYLLEMAELLGLEIDDKAEENAEDAYTVNYAINGRCHFTVHVPNNVKDKLAYIKDEAEQLYCDADFGQLEDIDGLPISVEDPKDNFIWEYGQS